MKMVVGEEFFETLVNYTPVHRTVIDYEEKNHYDVKSDKIRGLIWFSLNSSFISLCFPIHFLFTFVLFTYFFVPAFRINHLLPIYT